MRGRCTLLGIGVVVSIAGSASGATVYVISYLSEADSPFVGLAASYSHLENFEDGTLNTPGVAGTGFNQVAPPGPQTDSVDGDDGAIDGFGTAGRSLYITSHEVEFTFDAGVLGSLPTYAGIAWTDVGVTTPGTPTGFGAVEVRFYDSADQLIGEFLSLTLGDGNVNGGTAEDRFIGYSGPSGVARMTVTMDNSTDWEVDHLQYGYVPGPGGAAMLGIASLAMLRRRVR